MGGLTISNKILERYFSFLKRFDDKTKKRLIIKLTDSLEVSDHKPFDLNAFHGRWEDTRSSDKIISEVRESRVESKNSGSF